MPVSFTLPDPIPEVADNVLGAQGLFAPGEVVNGTTEGDVNIYGHDSYPLGFDCANPYTWPAGNLPTYFHASHEEQSPSTFYSLNEFQVSRNNTLEYPTC